jgi:hypothetical protein
MPQPTTTPGPGSTAASAPKGRAPHRRNEQARIAVLHAADDLLAALIEDSQESLVLPATGSAIEDARQYLRRLAAFITGDPAGQVLLALIGEAQHDAEMAGVFHARYLDPRRDEERAMLARGVASGELPPDLDADRALDALLGPVYYRALVTSGPISAAFTDALVTDVLG